MLGALEALWVGHSVLVYYRRSLLFDTLYGHSPSTINLPTSSDGSISPPKPIFKQPCVLTILLPLWLSSANVKE
ncbi:hypothetical protein TNCV_2966121 [Trichonephila clavipes]|nr:hypothetical protein TNCV_2966121 [Trichonephila clavipes]